ncbi:MAG: hypothetical protein ACK4YP_26535, partial [Myxococcota bacterium]
QPRAAELDPELFAASEAFRRAEAEGRPFREVYKEVGAEVFAGTFVAVERPAAPTPDLAALRARLPAARPDSRETLRALLSPVG